MTTRHPDGGGATTRAGGRPRLLVLRALGLGDLLTAVPALRALERAFPGHSLELAAPAGLADAAAATGAVDRLLPVEAPGRAVPERIPWFGEPPELAVDLHGNGPESRDLLAALRPGRLLAYHGGPVAWREREHERARWCRLLSGHGIPADPDDLRLPPPGGRPSPAPGAVLLHPGADAPARRWPPERFAAVARALRRRGERVVVLAGPGEEHLAQRVARDGRTGDDPTPLIVACPPWAVLARLVAEARALIAGDTGPAHLASALGTPSVVLFGPVSPELWGPPERGGRHRALWAPDDPELPRPGDPHGAEPDPLLLRLTPDDVLAAFDTLPPAEPAVLRSPSEAGRR